MPLTDAGALTGRDFLSLAQLDADAFRTLLDLGLELKRGWREGRRPRPFADRTLAMIFEKPSLRTRTTFDVAAFQLGGHAVLLSQDSVGLGRRESIRDVASNLERWVDVVMARVHAHATLEELARHADVPVVNGLSDRLHPCQITADYLTLRETFGAVDGLRIAFVGDGNNVCASHVHAAALSGASLVVGCPEGFDPDPEVVAAARARGADVEIVRDPREAARGADVLYTDVWISMGQEEDTARRREAFAGYTVTPDWFADLAPRGVFMHDLPAHYGEETVEEAVHHERSVVFDQAENRLHAHKAILVAVAGGAS